MQTRSIASLASMTAFGLLMACGAAVDSGDAEAPSTQEVIATTENALLVTDSSSTVSVTDTLVVTFGDVKLLDAYGAKDTLKAKFRVYEPDGSYIERNTGEKRIDDGESLSFGSNDSVEVDVRRDVGACFKVYMRFDKTDGSDKSKSAAYEYCWDGYDQWSARDLGYNGVGESAEATLTNRSKMRFTWKVEWKRTVMDGTLPVRTGDDADGAYWHTLMPFNDTWVSTTQKVSTRMDVSLGDPDLYLRAGSAPTSEYYNCRPYQGTGVTESCEDRLARDLWYGVRNYSTTKTATYRLFISK